MTTKLARAYLSLDPPAEGEERLTFVHAVVNEGCPRQWACVLLRFRPVTVTRSLGEPAWAREAYVRPRTLQKRQQVAEQARELATRLGWTLTPAEVGLLQTMEADRTRETVQ